MRIGEIERVGEREIPMPTLTPPGDDIRRTSEQSRIAPKRRAETNREEQGEY